MEEGHSASPDCLPRALPALGRADIEEGVVATPAWLPGARPGEARCQRGTAASLPWQMLL